MSSFNQHHFLFKRLIVESEWWLWDHVRCMGNLLYHTDEEIAEFIGSISSRIANLHIVGISLHADIVADALFHIADQRSYIEHLEYELRSPLRLFSDIEAITLQTDNHPNLQKPLQVKYHYGTKQMFIDEVRLNPAEVVCVLSYAKDDRRVILERKAHGERQYKWAFYILDRQYLPNGSGLNYDSLRDYLDPMKMHLIATTNSIFNEAFYDYDGTNITLNPAIKLKISIKNFDNDKFKEIPLNKRPADKKKVHQELIACRENKRNHLNGLQNLSSFYTYHKMLLEGK